MIDLTPLEVRKKKGDFRRTLRGYDPVLVDDFLDLAADRIEHLVRDNSAMAERLTELERRVAEYGDRERALTDALVTAQEMREEMRAQSTREAELALRTSTQEAEARLREAEQRAETVLRDAVQQAGTTVRESEQRAQSLMRDAEQSAASTVRAAEQGADDTLRRAQQEADAELRHAQQEAAALRADVVQVREREEETLRRLRLHQQQQLSSYRNFLERELSELDIIVASLGEGEGEVGEAEGDGATGGPLSVDEPESDTGPGRDSRAAAAAAVLAQSFLVEDIESYGGVPPAPEPFVLEPFEGEPFEPEPVYDEDLEPRAIPVEPTASLGGQQEEPAETDSGERPGDSETSALLENAALAGYHLELDDELAGEPELLLEEPASERSDDDDDDWLSSMIEEKG